MRIDLLRGGGSGLTTGFFNLLHCFFSPHLRAPKESRAPQEFQDPKACQASKEIRYHGRLERERSQVWAAVGRGVGLDQEEQGARGPPFPGEDISLRPNFFFQGSPGKTGPRGGVVSSNGPAVRRRVPWASGAWDVGSVHTCRSSALHRCCHYSI